MFVVFVFLQPAAHTRYPFSPFQETELRGRVLEEQLSGAEQRLEENQEEQENFRKSLRTLLELLDGKIFELTELRDTLARLIEEAS